jgi:hypothetical protein
LPDIVTLEEAARLLRLSSDELAKNLDSAPHFTVAGQIRFRKDALDEWMKAQENRSKGAEAKSIHSPGDNVMDFIAARARMSRMGRA